MALREPPPELHQRNACRDLEPEAFMLSPNPDMAAHQEAVRACLSCPVRRTCLQWGMESQGVGFMWGGQSVLQVDVTTPDGQRTKRVRAVPVRQCARCTRWFAPYRANRTVCSDRCSRGRNGYQRRAA
ncbi:WhiB family transcriptional regulator [Actinokineospora sp.]|uniref:WhiB family transcriptional regulator n=1 Tax=Actinokineospora sp. TaxID=1872133 RepID=UPI003D6C3C67